MQKFDVSNQKIRNEGDIDLCHDRIFIGSKKAFSLEILFDPSEKIDLLSRMDEVY